MSDAIPAGLVPLLQRRQFCLSSAPSSLIPSARQVRIADRWWLASHTDLELTHLARDGRSLTLLGYLLDPEDPAARNADILERLLPRLGRCADVIAPTFRLGGRWVLVAHDGTRTLVFHDAAALRAIYYVAGPNGSQTARCASEPGLLARASGLSPDPEALAYLRTRGDSDNEVYWMPGDTSPYAGIRALLPNHALDLETGVAARYWPVAPVPEVGFEQALAESARLLRGQLDAASRRWPLSISMTAGWDSRLMLALCRDVARDLFAFTLRYRDQYSTFPDVGVPARLLPRLGIRHHVIEYPARIDPDVKAVARLNSGALGSAYSPDTQALLEAHPADRVCVTGDVAEVVKAHYRVDGVPDGDLTAGHLARLLKIGDGPFARRAMEGWLASAPRPSPVPLLDLFCWEQMAGRWQARIRSEHDTALESLSPLNCRLLLATMLGVEEARRQRPGFELLSALIRELWPETLSEPINPPEVKTIRHRLVSVAASLGITKLVPRSAKDGLKRWLERTG
jgi:hypothetical protein